MLEKIKTRFSAMSGDKKSVLALVGGTTIAQALSFLFSPIQTRLFSPEVFGELSVFTSITGIAGVIICLRYELAIVLPKDDDEGFALLKLSWLFAAIVSGASLIAFGFFGPQIYARFNAPGLAGYWYYVPITLLLTGIIQASNYWLTRKRQFTILSWNKVLPVVVANLVSIGLGFAGNRALGARLFSTLVANIVNIAVLARAIVSVFRSKETQKQYSKIELTKKYKNFLVYDIWGALFNTLSWMIVPILFNTFFSSYEAGQYSLSLRVVQLPMSLISASYSQVFFKNASERYFSKNLCVYTKKSIKYLFFIMFPINLVLAFFSKPLFSFLFGKNWLIAGTYTQVLSLYAITASVASPVSIILTVANKQNIALMFNFIVLILRVLSMYIGKLLNNAFLALLIFSITGFIFNAFNIYYFINTARVLDKRK